MFLKNLSIKKIKIMAFNPITSWQIEEEKVEAVTDFLCLGSKNHCRWWLQPWNQKTIASWQESDDKSRQCVEKQTHFSVDNGPYSQGYGLPSGHTWLWELDCKEPSHQRNDAFELCCWRRLLKVPWTARSNQSILRDINPEYSLERLMLKLKLQHFGHLMWTANTREKTLMLGKIEDRRRGQRMTWLDDITDTVNMNLGKFGRWWRTGRPGMLQSTGSQRVGHKWATEQQHMYNWIHLLKCRN